MKRKLIVRLAFVVVFTFVASIGEALASSKTVFAASHSIQQSVPQLGQNNYILLATNAIQTPVANPDIASIINRDEAKLSSQLQQQINDAYAQAQKNPQSVQKKTIVISAASLKTGAQKAKIGPDISAGPGNINITIYAACWPWGGCTPYAINIHFDGPAANWVAMAGGAALLTADLAAWQFPILSPYVNIIGDVLSMSGGYIAYFSNAYCGGKGVLVTINLGLAFLSSITC